MNAVISHSLEAGAAAAVVSDHWAQGGAGAVDLARAVQDACRQSREVGSPFQFLYPLAIPIKHKIEAIAREISGADGVDYSELAEERIAAYEQAGYNSLDRKSTRLNSS